MRQTRGDERAEEVSQAGSGFEHARGAGLSLLALLALLAGLSWGSATSSGGSMPLPSSPALQELAERGWGAPNSDCSWVYRFRVDEVHQSPDVSLHHRRGPEKREHEFRIQRDRDSGELHFELLSPDLSLPAPPTSWNEAPATRPAPEDSHEPEARALRRELARGPAQRPGPRRGHRSQLGHAPGPAATDLACRAWTWDPLEDALALAWPALPAEPAEFARPWEESIEGSCGRWACVDAEGQGLPQASCRVPPWTHRLESVGAEEGLLIRSSWSLPAPRPDQSRSEAEPIMSATRVISLDLARRRPQRVAAEIELPILGVRRSLSLEAIDSCPP